MRLYRLACLLVDCLYIVNLVAALISDSVRHIARVYDREQASRERVTGESMEEDDMVKSIGIASYRDELMKRGRGEEGCKPEVLIRRCQA